MGEVSGFSIAPCVEIFCGREKGHCSAIHTERAEPSWPRLTPYTLSLCLHRETWPHRILGDPSKHLCQAAVWREVALFRSKISATDLKTGSQVVSGPWCRTRRN